jgi:hypothetical protein
MNMKLTFLNGKILTKSNMGVSVRFLDAAYIVSANDKAGQASASRAVSSKEAPRMFKSRYERQS